MRSRPSCSPLARFLDDSSPSCSDSPTRASTKNLSATTATTPENTNHKHKNEQTSTTTSTNATKKSAPSRVSEQMRGKLKLRSSRFGVQAAFKREKGSTTPYSSSPYHCKICVSDQRKQQESNKAPNTNADGKQLCSASSAAQSTTNITATTLAKKPLPYPACTTL